MQHRTLFSATVSLLLVACVASSQSILCCPWNPALDTADLQRSLASAATITTSSILVLQAPTSAFQAFCFTAMNSFGAADVAANQRLLRAQQVQLLSSARSVPIYDLGVSGATMFTKVSTERTFIDGRFSLLALILVAAFLAAFLVSVGVACWCWCRKGAEEFTEIPAHDESECSSMTLKTLQPVHDHAALPNSDVASVLSVFGVEDAAVDRLEARGYTDMEQLQRAMAASQLDDIMMELDLSNTARQRIVVACCAFSSPSP